MPFKDALTVKDDSDCNSKQFDNKQLTTPHSTALIDFDGDCMTDLFIPVKDSNGNKYYEIYVRREKGETIDLGDSTGAASKSVNGTK